MGVIVELNGRPFTCNRVVLNSRLSEASVISGFASHLQIPVIKVPGDEAIGVIPQPQDLWVGTHPKNGFNGMEAYCTEVPSADAQTVADSFTRVEIR